MASNSDDEPASRWVTIDFLTSSSDDENHSDPEWVMLKPRGEAKRQRTPSKETQEDDDVQEEETTKNDDDVGYEDLIRDLHADGELDVMEAEGSREAVLITKIVRRFALPLLPAKPLVRFQCVSKRWRRMISSPFFVHEHARLPHEITGVFFNAPRGGSLGFLAFEPAPSHGLPDATLLFLPEPARVLASARGLCSGRYYVCNPLTRQRAALPPPRNDHGADPAVALVFAEPITYNFAADYHLVCCHPVSADCPGVYAFETFSSRHWAWRASADIFPAEHVEFPSGVGVRGAAYWRTCWGC